MRVTILDRGRLAEACRQMEAWEGSRRDAAARLGLGIGQFHRMRNAQVGGSLNSAVFQALWNYLPPEHVQPRALRAWERNVEQAVVDPDGEERLRAYAAWLRREM